MSDSAIQKGRPTGGAGESVDHIAKAREFLSTSGDHAESRTEDLLASVAHSLVAITDLLAKGPLPQKWILNCNDGDVDMDVLKRAMNTRDRSEG